jgi:hypothetical protein
MARDTGERGHEAYALRLLGEVAAARAPEDPDAAAASFAEAAALAEALAMRPLLAHCLVGRAQVERRAGRPDRAARLLEDGVAALRELEMPFWLDRVEARARSLA